MATQVAFNGLDNAMIEFDHVVVERSGEMAFLSPCLSNDIGCRHSPVGIVVCVFVCVCVCVCAGFCYDP